MNLITPKGIYIHDGAGGIEPAGLDTVKAVAFDSFMSTAKHWRMDMDAQMRYERIDVLRKKQWLVDHIEKCRETLRLIEIAELVEVNGKAVPK